MNRIKQITINFLLVIPFLLVLSTVFVIDKSLANGVVSGKYFWFYLSMGIVNLSMLVFALSRRFHFRFAVQDFLVLLLVGSILFSSFIINDALQNTTKWVVLALLAVLYFSLRMLFEREDTTARSWVCFFIVITGLVEAVWGLRQLYGFSLSQHSLFKLTGSFFNPGPYSGYLGVVFPLALHDWIKGTLMTRITRSFADNKLNESQYASHSQQYKNPCKPVSSVLSAFKRIFPAGRYIACATCVAIMLVLPAAMSRASWLAVSAGSLIVLCGHYSKRFVYLKNYFRINKKKMIAVGIIACVVLFAVFTGMYFLKKDSADGRSLMWKMGLQTAQKNPFGVGLGNFPGAYGDVQAAYFAAGKGSETEEHVAGGPESGFNEYLQIAVESGVIALVLFLAIVFLSLRSLIMNRRWGVAGSMVSLLVFAFFSYPFSVLPFLIIFVFLLGNGTEGTQMTQMTQIHAIKKFRFVLIRAFCVICVPLITAFCLHKAYPVYHAYKKWNMDKIYYGAGLYKDVANDYKELYPYLNDQIQFLFEYAQSLSKSEQYTASNEVLQRAMQISCDPMLYNIMGKNHQALKEYDRAETCFLKASHIAPNRLYPFYLLAKLYHEMGWQDKVDEMAGIVRTKEPKVKSRAVEEMREEVEELRIKKLKN